MSFRREAVPAPARSRSDSKSFPAPILGWVSAQNLANNKVGTALVMDGWFPTTTGCRLFGGSLKVATIGTDPVESMGAYVSGSQREMFACDAANIFNITNPSDPDTAPTADVTGQTSGYYSFVPFATAGGNYLYALNGTDDPQLYDGSSWATITDSSSPISITGTTDTAKLSQGTVYRERIFLVERDSLNVWALPINALGGAGIQISLAGVVKNGGSCVLVDTWSLDSGSGLDDKLVVVTTEGEVAIYSGSDPADPSNWGIEGVYEIGGAPLGKNATMRAGGDLVILTRNSAVPISQAVTKDAAALSLTAVSRNIEPDWRKDAAQRSALPWEIIKWPDASMAVVTNPLTVDQGSSLNAQVYAVNLETGAWCKRSGWPARCGVHHAGWVYIGTNDGTVLKIDTTGADVGVPYTSTLVMGWDHLKAAGYEKDLVSMRAQFLASTPFKPKLSASVNYDVRLPTPPGAAAAPADAALWDVAIWDQSRWDGGAVVAPRSTGWLSTDASGFVHAPQIQVTTGMSVTPDVSLISMDALFERGEIML